MDIQCMKCHSKFKVAEGKMPKDRAVQVLCPKCKSKITIEPVKPGGAAGRRERGDAAGRGELIEEVVGAQYDAQDRPFDFLEAGSQTALLCEKDPQRRNVIKEALRKMGYHVTEPKSARDALKQMRFHTFDMVILNELFDTDNPANNHVQRYIARLAISIRRSMFVALITESHRTMDNMAAFTKSVNLVINPKNINDVQKILVAGVTDNQVFYRVFTDSMQRLGRL